MGFFISILKGIFNIQYNYELEVTKVKNNTRMKRKIYLFACRKMGLMAKQTNNKTGILHPKFLISYCLIYTIIFLFCSIETFAEDFEKDDIEKNELTNIKKIENYEEEDINNFEEEIIEIEEENPISLSTKDIYEKGIELYETKKYKSAKEIFEIIISPKRELDTYTLYSLYYFALSAYQLSDLSLADYTLKFIKNIESENTDSNSFWKQIDEINYWLAKIKFEKKDYIKALMYLDKITSSKLKLSSYKLKKYFLEKMDNPLIYNDLLRIYPKDKVLINLASKRISTDPFIDLEKLWVKNIIQEFNLNIKKYDSLKNLSSIKKYQYNIAVLLPFIIEEQTKDEIQNKFVIDLYKGIKLAIKHLKNEGIRINIHAYDTKSDVNVTRELITKDELKKMDLIIGPLYPKTVDLVSKFAFKYQINMVNPLSVNSKITQGNPFVYLFNPSIETQARKAAEYTSNLKGEKRIGILYSNRPEDIVNANTYKKFLEKYSGTEVKLMLKLSKSESKAFLMKFRIKKNRKKMTPEEIEEEEKQKAIFDDITHLYVASNDKLVVGNIFAIINLRKIYPEIIGHQKWLNYNTVTFNTLQRLKVKMIAPEYIDYKKESFRNFRKTYFDVYEELPDIFSKIGYELTMFFGNSLNKYGTYFQKKWGNDKSYNGYIFSGVKYGKFSDNQCINMMHIEKGVCIIDDDIPELNPYDIE